MTNRSPSEHKEVVKDMVKQGEDVEDLYEPNELQIPWNRFKQDEEQNFTGTAGTLISGEIDGTLAMIKSNLSTAGVNNFVRMSQEFADPDGKIIVPELLHVHSSSGQVMMKWITEDREPGREVFMFSFAEMVEMGMEHEAAQLMALYTWRCHVRQVRLCDFHPRQFSFLWHGGGWSVVVFDADDHVPSQDITKVGPYKVQYEWGGGLESYYESLGPDAQLCTQLVCTSLHLYQKLTPYQSRQEIPWGTDGLPGTDRIRIYLLPAILRETARAGDLACDIHGKKLKKDIAQVCPEAINTRESEDSQDFNYRKEVVGKNLQTRSSYFVECLAEVVACKAFSITPSNTRATRVYKVTVELNLSGTEQQIFCTEKWIHAIMEDCPLKHKDWFLVRMDEFEGEGREYECIWKSKLLVVDEEGIIEKFDEAGQLDVKAEHIVGGKLMDIRKWTADGVRHEGHVRDFDADVEFIFLKVKHVPAAKPKESAAASSSGVDKKLVAEGSHEDLPASGSSSSKDAPQPKPADDVVEKELVAESSDEDLPANGSSSSKDAPQPKPADDVKTKLTRKASCELARMAKKQKAVAKKESETIVICEDDSDMRKKEDTENIRLAQTIYFLEVMIHNLDYNDPDDDEICVGREKILIQHAHDDDFFEVVYNTLRFNQILFGPTKEDQHAVVTAYKNRNETPVDPVLVGLHKDYHIKRGDPLPVDIEKTTRPFLQVHKSNTETDKKRNHELWWENAAARNCIYGKVGECGTISYYHELAYKRDYIFEDIKSRQAAYEQIVKSRVKPTSQKWLVLFSKIEEAMNSGTTKKMNKLPRILPTARDILKSNRQAPLLELIETWYSHHIKIYEMSSQMFFDSGIGTLPETVYVTTNGMITTPEGRNFLIHQLKNNKYPALMEALLPLPAKCKAPCGAPLKLTKPARGKVCSECEKAFTDVGRYVCSLPSADCPHNEAYAVCHSCIHARKVIANEGNTAGHQHRMQFAVHNRAVLDAMYQSIAGHQ